MSPKLLRAAVPSVPKAAPKPVPLEVVGGEPVFGTLEPAFGALEPTRFPSIAAKPVLLGVAGAAEDEELDPPSDIPALPSWTNISF